MIKKNRFLAGLGLLSAGLILVACGNGGSESNGDEAEADGNVTLTWSLWDTESTVYYEPLVEAFEAEHDGVTVELLDLGSTDYQTVLGTQLSGGDNTIDVVTVKDIPGYSSLTNRNLLEPLSERAQDLDLDQYAGTVEQITIDDEFYAIPMRNDFYVLYYNKSIFDDAGVEYPQNGMTYEEYDQLMRDVSKKATESRGEKVYGGHYHIWRSQVELYGILDGENTLVSTDYSFLDPIYEMAVSQQEDEIVQDYASLKTSNLHYSAAFYQDNVATMLMGTWFIPTLQEAIASGESQEFDWGIAKMPIIDGAEEGSTGGTMTSLGVSSNSKNKDLAYEFVEFVTGEEGAQIIADTGTIPAIQSDEVISKITSIEGFPEDEQSKEALETTNVYLELPLDENASEVETILNETHDNIMTYSTEISDGLKNASEQVSALKE
ncbi:ABC transporter substrate-binding protein [Marinilactibacillus sp. 15R]|uniref:ABC transporter substrate-binding protein n=1 Tax=Marinilactibacillus sp. 15R TaxID=1911586 RepID=UPI00090C7E30|nr:sugar ABC transporter substrate-binding protein [Marinilactibacillus sp. 15R]API89721.1 ABC transporter substrate-binding protein [Marinilactibacillus sp. 15R]